MKIFKNQGFLHGALLSAVAALLAMGLLMEDAHAPLETPVPAQGQQEGAAVGAAENGERVAAGCELWQTMGFSRCGHSVTRRISAPADLTGMDFAAVQGRYDLWQIESYGKDRIEMRRELNLFCPMHTVLGVNEAGEAVLSRNVYGDGMAVEKECGRALSEFSPEDQEKLLLGMGFETAGEAEAWLREH